MIDVIAVIEKGRRKPNMAQASFDFDAPAAEMENKAIAAGRHAWRVPGQKESFGVHARQLQAGDTIEHRSGSRHQVDLVDHGDVYGYDEDGHDAGLLGSGYLPHHRIANDAPFGVHQEDVREGDTLEHRNGTRYDVHMVDSHAGVFGYKKGEKINPHDEDQPADMGRGFLEDYRHAVVPMSKARAAAVGQGALDLGMPERKPIRLDKTSKAERVQDVLDRRKYLMHNMGNQVRGLGEEHAGLKRGWLYLNHDKIHRHGLMNHLGMDMHAAREAVEDHEAPRYEHDGEGWAKWHGKGETPTYQEFPDIASLHQQLLDKTGRSHLPDPVRPGATATRLQYTGMQGTPFEIVPRNTPDHGPFRGSTVYPHLSKALRLAGDGLTLAFIDPLVRIRKAMPAIPSAPKPITSVPGGAPATPKPDTFALHTDEHGAFTPERQALHEKIIQHFLGAGDHADLHQHYGDYARGKPQRHGVFMMGGTGVGKSKIIKDKYGAHHHRFVNIDPDAIKEHLPEYDKDDSAHTHEESSHVAKQLFKRTLEHGRNFIYDGTGSNPQGMVSKFNAAKDHGFMVHLNLVTAPRHVAWERNLKRARTVPRNIFDSIHDTVGASFAAIRHHADKARVINNI